MTKVAFFTQDVTVKMAPFTFFTQLFIPSETSSSLVISMPKYGILPLSEPHFKIFNFTAIYSYLLCFINIHRCLLHFFFQVTSLCTTELFKHIHVFEKSISCSLSVNHLINFSFPSTLSHNFTLMRNKILVHMHICCTSPQAVSISLASSSLWINVTGTVFIHKFLSN